MYQEMQQMDYQPNWWELAYNYEGELVGLIMPACNPTSSVIGYIGVVPEHRGCGYVNTLLARGTKILKQEGFTHIRADTDVHNVPMAQAFSRAGYKAFARRREYMLTIQTYLDQGV